MQAVIIATDAGERPKPLGDRLPAPMLPLGDQPVLAAAIRQVAGAGVRRIVICLHGRGGPIVGYAGDGGRWGVQIEYVLLREPLGAAGALRWAAPCLREPFVLLPADRVADFDLAAAIAAHQSNQAALTVVRRPDGATSGVFICEPELLGRIPEGRDELDEALLADLAGAGLALADYVADGYWNSLATPADLQAAQSRLLHRIWEREAQAKAGPPGLLGRRLTDGVWVGRGSYIHPSARLTPPVYIGPGCWVGRDAEIGPEALIGAGCVVGAGATVRRSTLLERTYVGRLALIDGRIADGGLLIDYTRGTAVQIDDPLLLGAVAPHPREGRAGWVGRLAGLGLLLLLAPLLLLLALLVALATGRRPIRRFSYIGAGGPARGPVRLALCEFALSGPDGSVGGLGRWLWRWELHRLPRLWNVVTGELALVGVRPLHPDEAAKLGEEWHQTRYARPAGFTGLWYVQRHLPYDLDAIVAADVYYAVTANWRTDVRLLVQTPLAWLAHRARKAEGEPALQLYQQIAS